MGKSNATVIWYLQLLITAPMLSLRQFEAPHNLHDAEGIPHSSRPRVRLISDGHCKSVAPILGNADSCDSRRLVSSASVEAACHNPVCAARRPCSPDSGRPI